MLKHSPVVRTDMFYLVGVNDDKLDVILKSDTNHTKMLTAKKRSYPGYTKLRIVRGKLKTRTAPKARKVIRPFCRTT